MASISDEVSDLSKLDNLDTEEILHQLKRRFLHGNIYTYIGDVLIAVNPYEDVPDLYNKELLTYYQTARDPPHIYWTAEQTYKRLRHEQGNQCIIVTGDSGAGKTESTKHLLHHLTNRSPCDVGNLVEKLNHVNPLIELFGNASTTLNRNSSRFGKLIELSYNVDGSLTGGKLKTFVLEKSRVVHHNPNENNFHIFHALFAGCLEQELRDKYCLEEQNEYRVMLGDDQMPHIHYDGFYSQDEKHQYRNNFKQGLTILKEIGFNEEDISQIINILAACLHLGNIEFDVVDDRTDGVAIHNDEYLLNAIPLLGLEDTADNLAELNEILISRPIIVQGQTLLRPFSQVQADNVRDSVVKGLYAGVFKAVIDQINKSIEGDSFVSRSRQLSIGILDISGFESLSENSLEQLFINITNEQIHQFHQHQIFKVENRVYIDEGIHLPPNSFQDNTAVLDLIFMSPGILSLLDDQMKLDNANDAKLVTDYNSHLGHRSDVYKQSRSQTEFGVIHFAGQVVYTTKGFLAKNRGTIPERVKEIFIEKSTNYIVNTYFDVSDHLTSHSRNGLRDTLSKKQARDIRDRYHLATKTSEEDETLRSKPKATNSAASQFRKSLSSLINILANAKPLFVRCIKPNTMQQVKNFDDKVVLAQLESSGIKDVARIRRDGYQIRVTFDNFCKMCEIIRQQTSIPENANDHHKVIHIINACNLDKDSYQIGHSKVFLKGHAMEKINFKMKVLVQQRKKEEEEERLKAELEQEIQRNKEHEEHLLNESYSERTEPGRSSSLTSKSIPSTITSRDTDSQSGDSHPPTYSDIEEERKGQKNRWAWDSFRNTERDYDGCVETENCFLKFCRLLMCLWLFIGLLSSGACTVLIPMLKVSQLNSDEDVKKRSDVVTELIVCYSIPIAVTFIQSVFKTCLGRVKNVPIKHFIPVLVMESIEVCGTAYFLFKVLPKHSTTSGITFLLTSLLCPCVLNIQKQIVLVKHRHKFIYRLLTVIIAVTALTIQYGVLICICVNKDIVLSDNVSQMPEYSTEDTVLEVGSLVAMSLGYYKNFLTCNISLGSLRLNIMDWKIAVEKARPKINFKMCIVKVGIFLGMTQLLVSDVSWKFTCVDSSQSSEQIFVSFMEDHKLMFIYILCTIYLNYAAQLACKLQMQRLAFFIPLILVPVVCFGGVIGYCYQWPADTNILDGTVVCPSIETDSAKLLMASGVSGGLWISLILLTWYLLFPKCHLMEKAERLFDLPTRDNFFSSFGLLLKRKDDVIEHQLLKHAKFKSHEESNTMKNEIRYKNHRRQTKKKQIRPYVYVCGTMWHETRTEMLQLLKSLFRLDFHRSTCKIAESAFGVNVEFFEQECHIIFDDAFQTDGKSGQRIPNDYVKQLLGCLEEALMSVAKGHVNWDSQPTKISTPYGGRLSWIMPGGTQMCFHLKDKQKIRHRKRWSQILYMYYLLGFKLMGAVAEDSLLTKETHKRYNYRRTTSLLNQLPKEKIKKAHNSFILTLDGDVDFKPEAVQKLIDKMTKNDKVGAVCGRIHPIGSGPVVWYQMFEYAVGHWLQKATEHVFGCVLCCPGAFSLFRVSCLMDDNVMRMYATPALEARNYIQMEQGEDRWLSTLLLQQGYKIDYCASADAYTFAPTTFKDFFIQRRRWGPSTLINIIDLLSSWRITTKINDNISTLYIFYQFTLLATSLLGIGTVTLMITGSFNAVLKTTMFESYLIVLIPIIVYAIICIKCSNDKQIAVAAMLSTIYTLVMVIVTVGLLVIFATEEIYSPNFIFFSLILVVFITAGIVHPKEFMCLGHGLIYYIMIPTTFIFLTVYYMCNIHIVSWGTRERVTIESESVKETNDTEKKHNPTLPLRYFKRVASFVKKSIGLKLDPSDMEGQVANLSNTQTTSIAHDLNHNKRRQSIVRQDPNAWQAMAYLGTKEKTIISEDETKFWGDMLDKYLHPIKQDDAKEAEIKAELLSLRNNGAFGLLMLNFLFATAIFQVQNNESQLKKLYILNEFEPVSVFFLSIFSLIILVQFTGMLIHRWGTFLHLISGMRLWYSGKGSEKEWIKQALKEAKTLQSADPIADMEETLSMSNLSVDSRINNNTNGKIIETEPDYPMEEPSEDYPEDEIQPKNQYEQTFRRRFETIRHNFKRPSFDINSENVNVNRYNLYRKTFGQRVRGRLNSGYNWQEL